MQNNIAHDLDQKVRTKDVILEENVSFTSLLLKPELQNGLRESGFKKPSPIQFKAIPLGRCGFDLIVKSKSGTGKTLVFSTIALESVNISKEHLQVLILVPTREIAVQIQDVLRSIGRFITGLSVESFIGGMPLDDDVKKAKQCHIAVGAPGRVKHLINLEALSTKFVRLFVLDEADKLMDLTFQKDINEIFDTLPERKQIIAASATYPRELETFLANYMLSPTHVTSENETPLLLGLKQFVAVLKATTINAVQQMKAKNEMLLEIFKKVEFTQCLVFTNYQSRTESVCNFLNQNGWQSSFISAAVGQSERLEAINNLKNFKSKILLSTDLTSRGIDAPNVDLVINYDLPLDAVTYLHRMGRAGRYGSSGICINFALEGSEMKRMQLILGTIGATNLSISKLPPLNGNDSWQLDPNNLEQIWGVVPEVGTDVSEEIKKEIMTMKECSKNDKKNKKNKKKIRLEEFVKSECVEDVLKEKEQDAEKNFENCLDAENLLTSLIENSNDEESKKRKRSSRKEMIKLEDLVNADSVEKVLKNKKENERNLELSDDLKTEDLLSSLVATSEVEDTKKRKLNESTELLQNDKNTTFSKNKALLNITKLLYDSNVQIDIDLVESIDDYLLVLKKNHPRETLQKTVEEILTNDDTQIAIITKTEELDLKVDEENTIEDIFKIGYDSILKNQDGTFLNHLPNDELQNFQDFCRQEQISISSESENEEELDYEMEEYEEETRTDQDTDMALQWVPVVHTDNSQSQTNNDHFEKCYDDCSNTLWQNGLTFETVPQFDDWYYQWQEQLQSVRNYVQQNIYVEEMSKYQQNRLSNT